MKLLIYSHAFAPMVGGVETVVVALAKGLAREAMSDGREGLDVTVVTPAPGGEFDDAALPFRVVRQPGLPRLVSLIRQADAIHLAGPAFLPMLFGCVLRKPLVVEHHGFHTICPNGQLFYEPTGSPCPGHFMAGRHGECLRCNAKMGWLSSFKLWFLTFSRRWLCGHASSNITPTQWLGNVLQLPRSKTIYHSLPQNESRELSRPMPMDTTFAFVGRLVSVKGVRTLLEAAQQLRAEGFRFQLKVIGDGPERGALQQESVVLGLRDYVQFLGYLSPERLQEHLLEVAAVVMPSLGGEVFGMVAAESMLRGKLVIVSGVGALKEVVGDAGLWFAPGDSTGLAACLQKALTEPGLVKALSEKARLRALQVFREERMVAEHLAVYCQVVEETRSAPHGQPTVVHPIRHP